MNRKMGTKVPILNPLQYAQIHDLLRVPSAKPARLSRARVEGSGT